MAKSDKPIDSPVVTNPPKRRWEAPRIKTGQLFESNSLACGKNNPMMEPCIQNGNAS